MRSAAQLASAASLIMWVCVSDCKPLKFTVCIYFPPPSSAQRGKTFLNIKRCISAWYVFGRRCRGNVLLNPKILPDSFYGHILEWNAAGCGVSLQSCEHEEGDGGWGRFKRQEAYFSCMCLYRQHCLTGTQWYSLLMKQQLQMLNQNDRTHKQGFGLEASAVITTAFLLINLHNIHHYRH